MTGSLNALIGGKHRIANFNASRPNTAFYSAHNQIHHGSQQSLEYMT